MFSSCVRLIMYLGQVPGFNIDIDICVSTHRKGPVVSEDQIDFLVNPRWLFFHFNFSAKIFEIGHCVLEIWQFY